MLMKTTRALLFYFSPETVCLHIFIMTNFSANNLPLCLHCDFVIHFECLNLIIHLSYAMLQRHNVLSRDILWHHSSNSLSWFAHNFLLKRNANISILVISCRSSYFNELNVRRTWDTLQFLAIDIHNWNAELKIKLTSFCLQQHPFTKFRLFSAANAELPLK